MKRKMVALVIGNAEYENGGVLRNPVNDARDIAFKLSTYGFSVTLLKDGTSKQMDKMVKSFRAALEGSDVGLFFFAGHGMQIDGENYLLAVDTDTETEDDAKHDSLPLNKVISTLDKSDAVTKIVILDACRNNPWERAWTRTAVARGLASVYAPKGTIIGFSTSPGQFASDGVGGNGAYTAALLQHIDAPDCDIETMFKRVRNTLAADTAGKQTSWEHTSLSGSFHFNISIGRTIDDYKPTALKDSLFVIDETRPSHRIIKGLKSLNWPTQNAALAELTPTSVKKMVPENLFVLGRNIYQAACGSSHAATSFIRSFMEETAGYPNAKRKALLDGMLFEIFFDSDAKLRPDIKGEMFDDVFDLQKHAPLSDSFAFIAGALVTSRGAFYSIPGKGHEVSVSIKTVRSGSEFVVKSIYVDGVDVLRLEDDEYAASDGEQQYFTWSRPKFEHKLSREMLVPPRLADFTYTPTAASDGMLKFPMGYTVKRA
jgi:hypothetical protein